MLRTALTITAATASLCLAASPGIAAQPSQTAAAAKPAGRTLVITIRGLPGTTQGRVEVTGPGSFRTTVLTNGTRTLTKLKPGTYRLKAKPVTTSFGKATVKNKKRTAQVSSKKGARVLIAYDTPGTS